MTENKLIYKVFLVDDSFKTIAVKSTLTAAELVVTMAEKVSLTQKETFAIFYMKGQDQRCLDADEQPCRVVVSEVISPDADFAKYTEKSEWEKVKKEFERDSKLVFKRRVFLKHKNVTKDDDAFLSLTYAQANACIREGTYPCSEGAALELAGLTMQVNFGDHNKRVHVAGFLKDKIDKFLPAPLLKNSKKLEDWEKDIFSEHARITGMKKPDAMLQYLNKVRQWHFYGCTFWEVQTVNKDNSSLPDKVTLSVSSTGIQLLKTGTKEPILIQRYADIYSWAYKKNAFAFVSGVLSKQKFQFVTANGKDIARTLQAYVEILLEERKKNDSKPLQSTD